jgi:hypothetical protein
MQHTFLTKFGGVEMYTAKSDPPRFTPQSHPGQNKLRWAKRMLVLPSNLPDYHSNQMTVIYLAAPRNKCVQMLPEGLSVVITETEGIFGHPTTLIV